MIPIYIKVQQSTARMAVMRPEMDKLNATLAKDPNFKSDPALQSRYQQEMKALMVKYDVNPLRAVSLPILQLPIFISFFQGLRNMGDFFPGFKTGGALWFSDLTVADATMILPVLNSVSFLLMVELGGEGAPAAQQQTFKMVMRGLSVIMIPATMSFNQGLFVYWSANNLVSIIQGVIFKIPAVREALNIPKAPVPVAGAAAEQPFAKFVEVKFFSSITQLTFHLFRRNIFPPYYLYKIRK
jgi:YidC/Oxa1 family membrane protein insertase